MARKPRPTALPAPFLKRLWVLPENFPKTRSYPFNLPWLDPETFELDFAAPVTILVGENGTGKSTLVEAIAALA